MLKYLILLLAFCVCNVFPTYAQESSRVGYTVSLDLTNVNDDQIKVSILTPPIHAEKAVFVMPVVIPGAYSKDDYGRFVVNPIAYDAKNNMLTVERTSVNEFTVLNAYAMKRFEYSLNDTFDAKDSNIIFQPCGSSFAEGRHFVLNHNAILGYFDGFKNYPYSVTVRKPAQMYGSTSLAIERVNDTTDILRAKSYVQLVDNPILYAKPDTASYYQGKTRINVAMYTANQKSQLSAKALTEILKPVTLSVERFFGTMPVDSYTFLFYFTAFGSDQDVSKNGVFGMGALEHSYCSMYFLADMSDIQSVKSQIDGAAIHEFLHTFAPLHLHSEYVDDFNFRTPRMSRHLWMYEGATEYFSMIAGFRGGIYTKEAFLKEMSGKIRSTESLKEPLSLVNLSENVLEPKNKNLYPMIYEKGPAVDFLLDIRLRELSGGKTGLYDVLRKLADIYGPSKPFKDEEFFDIFVKATYPEIRTFFEDYIIGAKPLPYEEYMPKAGILFSREKEVEKLGFGINQVYMDQQGEQTSMHFGTERDNEFGLERNDAIVSVEGISAESEEFGELMHQLLGEPVADKEITVVVKREGKETTLKAKPKIRKQKKKFAMELKPDATAGEKELFNAILGAK